MLSTVAFIARRASSGRTMAQSEKARITTDETSSTLQLGREERSSRSSWGPLLRSLRDTGLSVRLWRSCRRAVPPNRPRSSGGGGDEEDAGRSLPLSGVGGSG